MTPMRTIHNNKLTNGLKSLNVEPEIKELEGNIGSILTETGLYHQRLRQHNQTQTSGRTVSN